MAFAEAYFRILQTVEFFRHGANGFGNELQRSSFDGFFACFGHKHVPFDGHKVTHSHVFFEKSISLITQVVFGNVELYLAGEITNMGKSGFSHQAQLYQATGGADFGFFGSFFGFGARMCFFTMIGIRVDAGGLKFFSLGVALGNNTV